MITSASITETTPSSASAVRPTPRIVIGSTHPRLGAPIPASAAAGPSTGASQTFVKQTPAGGQKQENLYIVTLPEHLKRAGGVVQYTTQVLPTTPYPATVDFLGNFLAIAYYELPVFDVGLFFAPKFGSISVN